MDVPYTALARRFRPQTFAEVVGQERIAATLRNAILEGRVAHAYLFTGARGVGKTSMARIFAKALNCPNAAEGVPCNSCEICRGISVGQDVDVSEIDGASNRGIDDIRALRANVNVRSMRSKYKIYIVDEVHMLTKEAFNALLKTLEEPPPAVKFIFCTTEPNKVPDTILSRCQRFDFGTISTAEITTRLHQLAEAEGFEVEPAALDLVARRAAGSMRDSQSLFDQLLAFGSQRITAADVHWLFGTAPDARLVTLAQALLDRQPDAALATLQQALQEGVQLEPFVDQIVAYFRDLMVLAAGTDDLTLSSVAEERRPQLCQQAERWGLQSIVAALEILAETKLRMQRSTFGRALTELALVRISLLRDLDRLDELLAQLKGGGAPAAAARANPPRSTERIATLPEKKTPEREVERSGPSPRPVTSSAPVAEPFTASEVLARLIARFNDITGTYLRQAASSAIIGPNQLEISFPTRYDLGRKACEKPEVVSRLEAALAEITGQPWSLRFRSVASEVSAPMAPPPVNPARRPVIEDPQDPLVREVGKVFGVPAWQMQELGRTVATDAVPE